MENQFGKLDDVLYKDLRPWLDKDKDSVEYGGLLKKLNTVKPEFKAYWDVEFHRPMTPKAQYYCQLILNEIDRCCNNVLALINEDDRLMRQQYWYKDIMVDKLPIRLKDVIELIKEQRFFVEYMDPKNANFDVNIDHKTNTYIIQLLKVAWVKIYLEIQERYHYLGTELKISEADVYDRFFDQPLPENSFLKRNLNESIAREAKVEDENRIKDASFQSFTYKNIDKHSDKLVDLFRYLKENKLIADDTPLANFKTIFTGNEVYSPVVWNGSVGELFYFVYLLHSDFELIVNLKRRLWRVVGKCFLQYDGSQFDLKKLKGAPKPDKNEAIIKNAVDLLR